MYRKKIYEIKERVYIRPKGTKSPPNLTKKPQSASVIVHTITSSYTTVSCSDSHKIP